MGWKEEWKANMQEMQHFKWAGQFERWAGLKNEEQASRRFNTLTVDRQFEDMDWNILVCCTMKKHS